VLSARHDFALVGKPGSRTATASSMWPCPPVLRTPSPARAVVLNAMSYLVSTFISPPWSARPNQPAGGTGGGTGPCAGCSPRPAQLRFLGDAPCDDRSTFSAGVKSLLTAGLRRLRSGGGLCRPLSLTGTQPQFKGQPWRERPTLGADVIADAAKTRGRSRHGCPLSCGSVPVRGSGRHRAPPERSRRNPAVSNDLTPVRTVAPSSQRASPTKGNRTGRGEHPAQGPVPPPVPPVGWSGRPDHGGEMKVLTR
jgi:hypothetical protein